MSNDEAIVGQLIKGRERCRQLVQLYRCAYDEFETRGVVRLPMEKACAAANQLLAHLRALPCAPARQVKAPELRKSAEQILTETSDLLQGVLVIEREFRESVMAARTTGRCVAA